MIISRFLFILLCVFAVSITAQAQAQAQDNPTFSDEIDDASQFSANTSDYPMLRLTPDKSELITLDKNAVSVIVGNPAHLSVLLDTPRLLVLVPKVPGATYFTVLDNHGEILMQRHVIVASPKKNYVRIRRSCAAGVDGCQSTSVYFCPEGMCHEISVAGSTTSASSESADTTSATTDNAASAAGNPDPAAATNVQETTSPY